MKAIKVLALSALSFVVFSGFNTNSEITLQDGGIYTFDEDLYTDFEVFQRNIELEICPGDGERCGPGEGTLGGKKVRWSGWKKKGSDDIVVKEQM